MPGPASFTPQAARRLLRYKRMESPGRGQPAKVLKNTQIGFVRGGFIALSASFSPLLKPFIRDILRFGGKISCRRCRYAEINPARLSDQVLLFSGLPELSGLLLFDAFYFKIKLRELSVSPDNEAQFFVGRLQGRFILIKIE